MDRISQLPDDLLVKMLSFVPTQVAVSTSILSKRWNCLWMWLPNLDYSSRFCCGEGSAGLWEFINKNLPLHRAPVIESLRLDLISRNPLFNPEDIKRWVEIAVSHSVRELNITYDSDNGNIFPSSFYTCKSLVDVPSTVCLPSLKTLELESVAYPNQESLQRLLSICPVLEELSMHYDGEHDKLSLYIGHDLVLEGYVIDAPSLKYLKLDDQNNMVHYSDIKSMPKLYEAYVDFFSHDLKSFIGSVTSVKRLTICSQDDVYGDGLVFNQLEHLTLCVCKNDSLKLLGQFLKDSPNLRVLDIGVIEGHWIDECGEMVRWNQPSPVPQCLLSSLQILNWSRYFGRPQERDIAVYILKNACA
ncbi:hypothetical protein EUTSA_v10027812mg [Eutrema salsugineum]|uniref:Uncharacterized protein n=1 Tax=Eutrema salsugineum TaxID=72664 RepID=V4LTR4_EUTSA|nr:hypothetical protein EUTSA_v10027812mg [Eutrema salsugineum]